MINIPFGGCVGRQRQAKTLNHTVKTVDKVHGIHCKYFQACCMYCSKDTREISPLGDHLGCNTTYILLRLNVLTDPNSLRIKF